MFFTDLLYELLLFLLTGLLQIPLSMLQGGAS